MIGQGLQRCVEAALEWRADDVRGEKSLLDDSTRLRSFLEGAAGDQEVVDIYKAVCTYRGGEGLRRLLT
jgi:hypothetical protein